MRVRAIWGYRASMMGSRSWTGGGMVVGGGARALTPARVMAAAIASAVVQSFRKRMAVLAMRAGRDVGSKHMA
jgi:hypothetical protein